jgi:hypothetical protein
LNNLELALFAFAFACTGLVALEATAAEARLGLTAALAVFGMEVVEPSGVVVSTELYIAEVEAS